MEDLPGLYKAMDTFVLPSHGEVCMSFETKLELQQGWGRPHVEALSMGVPVIATNWSGPTAYLTEENGYPLSIEGCVCW